LDPAFDEWLLPFSAKEESEVLVGKIICEVQLSRFLFFNI
jgi:hypothetical protein